MRKILCIVCLTILYFSVAACQEFKVNIRDYSYFIDSIEINLTTLQIKNPTKENLLVWIERNSAVGSTMDQKVKSYFFKNKGDFSLIQLVNENLVNEIKPVVFSSFIKEVTPNDSFLITIIHRKESNEILDAKLRNEIQTFFENNVICMHQDELTQYFDLLQFKSIYYRGEMLCIQWSDISQDKQVKE